MATKVKTTIYRWFCVLITSPLISVFKSETATFIKNVYCAEMWQLLASIRV